jgi:hypothetical protein
MWSTLILLSTLYHVFAVDTFLYRHFTKLRCFEGFSVWWLAYGFVPLKPDEALNAKLTPSGRVPTE